jgi:hypothetical protein
MGANTLTKEGTSMFRFLGALLLALLLLTACNGQSTEAPPDVNQLLSQANANLHTLSTFRLSLEQSGAPYYLSVNLGEGAVDAEVRRATAQYVAPDVMQGNARILIGALPLDIELFARLTNQWLRLGGVDEWSNIQFAPGFDPSTLQSDGGGFDQAIEGLAEAQYVGAEELDSGAQVYHISGLSDGNEVAALTVGLIVSEFEIHSDIYIDRETRYPVRVVLTQPETVTEEEPVPTTWIIDLYDFNEPPDLDDPEANGASEATAEATADATSEATPEAESDATTETTAEAEVTATP